MIASYQEPNFYKSVKTKLKDLAKKFRQIEIGWIARLQSKHRDSQKRKKHAVVALGSSKGKNNSNTQNNSKVIGGSVTGLHHIALLRQTPPAVATVGLQSIMPKENPSTTKNALLMRNDFSNNQISIDQEAQSP